MGGMNLVIGIVAVLAAAVSGMMFAQQPMTKPPTESCLDIERLNFNNRLIVFPESPHTSHIFRFHSGVFDTGDIVDSRFVVDVHSMIERDVVLHPASNTTVRFIQIFETHVGGSGSCKYLLGYRCTSGKVRMIFHEFGEGMEVLKLSVSEIRLSLGVWAHSDSHCCPSAEKDSRYTWNPDEETFTLKDVTLRRLR